MRVGGRRYRYPNLDGLGDGRSTRGLVEMLAMTDCQVEEMTAAEPAARRRSSRFVMALTKKRLCVSVEVAWVIPWLQCWLSQRLGSDTRAGHSGCRWCA